MYSSTAVHCSIFMVPHHAPPRLSINAKTPRAWLAAGRRRGRRKLWVFFYFCRSPSPDISGAICSRTGWLSRASFTSPILRLRGLRTRGYLSTLLGDDRLLLDHRPAAHRVLIPRRRRLLRLHRTGARRLSRF